MEYTRHRVIAKEVVNLTSRELLNFPISLDHLSGEEGRVTRYVSLLSLDVAIVAYLLSNMAALSAGFKLAKLDDRS